MELFLSGIILLQLFTLILVLKNQAQTKRQVTQTAESELDKVLDEVVDRLIKNHETKITKTITQLTNQAQTELQTSTTQLTALYKTLFDQKLAAVLADWSEHQRQDLDQVITQHLAHLEAASEKLVQQVATQSLKHHLTLADHDQLVKNSLSSILNSLPSNITRQTKAN